MQEPVFNDTLQIGIVVRDLEATVRRYEDYYGIGPWEVHEFNAGEAEDFHEYSQSAERSWRGATTMVGQVMWELIEPLDKEGVFARFLDEKGEGVHHVAVGVRDFDETVAAEARRGGELDLSGRFSGVDVAYLNTQRDLGVTIEIAAECPATESIRTLTERPDRTREGKQMRKLIVVTFMSLDGFYEGPGKDVMALPMDVTFSEYNLERMKAADTVLLGADSYEGARGFWPQQKDNASAPPSDQEFSRLYDDIEKVVVSDHASLPQEGHPWAGTTRIVKWEDAREEITSLKEQDGGEIVMWGSRTLWNDLLVHGLVDELHVIIGAALLGSGTRTFGDFSASLRRIETRPFDGSDSVLIRYEVLQT